VTNFIGERVRPAPLRFDYSSNAAKDDNPRRGLRNYGPYDSGTFGRSQVTCEVIYPEALSNEKDLLVSSLTKGNGQFVGFQRLFRIPLVISGQKQVRNETVGELQAAVQSLASEAPPDLVIVVASARNERLYAAAKAELLGNGIPNQVVLAPKLLVPNQVPWILENIALQCYAKVGGTPWTVSTGDNRRELVIGVRRAQDRERNVVVGFVTLFTSDGDYLLMESLAPKPCHPAGIDEYRAALRERIVAACRDFLSTQGKLESIVVHLCKRAGRFNEVEAVEESLRELGEEIPYALVHLNEDTNFRLFDTSHRTYIPESFLSVEVDDYSRLLLLDGRGRR
jgi:argonaute-like protein implicated in RNA metabolism and viral defense